MSDELQDGIAPETVETAEATTAEEIQPTDTPAEGEEPKEEHPAEPPKKTGIEKRFSELTARAKAAEQYAARLEQLMDRFQQPQPSAPAPPAPTGKPTREQFDYDEDRYLEALTEFKVQERLSKAQEEFAVKQKQTETQRRQQEYAERVEKANKTGVEKFEDYDDVVLNNRELAVTTIMADAMTLTDIGPDIAYHLGKNPQEAYRIAQLSPQMQVMEIARLEMKLKEKPPKKHTEAPPPVAPVGGSAPAGAEPDPAKDPEGWLKWERNRVKALGRRY